VKELPQAHSKHGNSSNDVLKGVNPESSDLVLKSMLDDVLEIARRRAQILERMKQALLADDTIELKRSAQIICGMKEENQK
jgi:hypothetical protein